MTLSYMDDIDIIPIVFIKVNYKYLGGKPAYNHLKNLGITKGLLLMK